MRVISQDTPFVGKVVKGSESKLFAVTNFREVEEEGNISYLADGIRIIHEDAADEAIESYNISVVLVTTSKGVWNGDFKAQDRMLSSISQLDRKPEGTTKKWKMADKSEVDVNKDEIAEALDLAVDITDTIIDD